MLTVTRGFTRGLKTTRTAYARCSAIILPVLAQAPKTTTAETPAAEGGSWPILDWLIVTVLICGALFVICRSSRRN
jgi:hypothetical protein